MHAACRLIFNSGQHLDDAFIIMFNISTWTAQLHAKDHHSDLPRVIEKKIKRSLKQQGLFQSGGKSCGAQHLLEPLSHFLFTNTMGQVLSDVINNNSKGLFL